MQLAVVGCIGQARRRPRLDTRSEAFAVAVEEAGGRETGNELPWPSALSVAGPRDPCVMHVHAGET